MRQSINIKQVGDRNCNSNYCPFWRLVLTYVIQRGRERSTYLVRKGNPLFYKPFRYERSIWRLLGILALGSTSESVDPSYTKNLSKTECFCCYLKICRKRVKTSLLNKLKPQLAIFMDIFSLHPYILLHLKKFLNVYNVFSPSSYKSRSSFVE